MAEITHEELLKGIAIAKRDKATSLGLSKLDLTSLPPEIGELTGLERLDIHGNQLTSLPPEIGQLKQLRKMALGLKHGRRRFVNDLNTTICRSEQEDFATRKSFDASGIRTDISIIDESISTGGIRG